MRIALFAIEKFGLFCCWNLVVESGNSSVQCLEDISTTRIHGQYLVYSDKKSLLRSSVPTRGQEILQNMTMAAMSMAQSCSKAGFPAMPTVANLRLSTRTSLA
jgi:hypothetical protein